MPFGFATDLLHKVSDEMFEEKFEPKTLLYVLDYLDNCPAGRQTTALLACHDSKGRDLHITLFFRIISCHNVSFVWHLAEAIKQAWRFYSEQDVYLGEEANFRSLIYPKAIICKVISAWQPSWLPEVLSRVACRRWQPHVTVKPEVDIYQSIKKKRDEGKLGPCYEEEPIVLNFNTPVFTLAYGLNFTDKIRENPFNALEKGYGDYLGIPRRFW